MSDTPREIPRELPIVQREEHWPEHGVTIQWAAYEHWLDFMAKEGTQQDDGSIFYIFFDKSGAQQGSDEFNDGERLVEGTIKWDGCSHLTFGDERGYVHLCGGRSFVALTTVLRRVFHLAAEHVPQFDPECADLARVPATIPISTAAL